YDNIKDKFTDIQKLFTKAAKQSDTYTLAPNYSQLGIYIIHGSADSVVSPSQARSMMRELSKFHKDYDFHFEPDKEHWWDIDTVKPGTDCVDWTPMFDFFSKHARPLNRIKKINFTTAAPGISSKNYWISIIQQFSQFEFSNIDIEFVPEVNVFRTKLSNIKTFSIDTEYLGLSEGSSFSVIIDGQTLKGNIFSPKIYLTSENGKWDIINEINKNEKHPGRYGSFKDLFRDNLIVVYGTRGSERENDLLLAKVRYDSEMFWYIGNGSLEILSDNEFDPDKHKKSNILLYGTKEQNSAFDKLLIDSPISVSGDKISIGDNEITGNDLGCYSIYPKKGTENNLVGVIAGTGAEGIKLTYMRPFLKPGSSFPDISVFNTDILKDKESGINAVGIFGLDWSVENGEFILR
ncbi:MAG: prolyl oligopeptidase family serine peptidase, partial [Melioribacteraceae bacterium]|nr:prolyl oligopeptidase family serine peptidase [Melioribacteraceae bacterium]